MRLARQNFIGRFDGSRAAIFQIPVRGRRVILFDHISQAQHARNLSDDRESHGVAAGLPRKALAASTGVSAIAHVALMGLGRRERFRDFTNAPIGVEQRQARGVDPFARIEQRDGHEKRARHSGILTLKPVDTSRVDVLHQLLEQNPANAFARYGLAMEYVNSGEFERAMEQFQSIVDADASYAAAYFHGGQTLEKLGRPAQAREYYRRGIASARDPHARSELQAALDILGED